MKPIRRILFVVIFIIGTLVMVASIIPGMFQWLFTGKSTIPTKVADFFDSIINYINPD